MIIGTVAVTRGMVLAALAAIAFVIAVVGLFASVGFDVPTPGLWAALLLFPRDFSYFFAGLALQVTIDWLLWFALMCTVYLLITRRKRKPQQL